MTTRPGVARRTGAQVSTRIVGWISGGAVVAAAALLLTGCTTPASLGDSRSTPPTSVTGTPDPPSTDAGPRFPEGVLASAQLRGPGGASLGELTITAAADRVTVTFPGRVPRADSLRLTPAGGGGCADSGFAWSLPLDGPEGGVALTLPADDFAEFGDPTVFRSALLTSTRTDGSDCLLDVAGSAELHWTIAPRGLSAPIADAGPEAGARGTASATSYIPAAGDAPTDVAHRLGVTVGDLEWLNPPHFELLADVPVNLDPDRRGLPVNR